MPSRSAIIVPAILVALLAGSVVVTANSTPSGVSAEPLTITSNGHSPLSTPVGPGFTYQGRLKEGANPANGQYDFQFTLYDAVTRGLQVGSVVDLPNQTVTDGLFTVTLDFGAGAFNGQGRWLEINVQHADGGRYTTLTPRQSISPAPYALYALKSKGYKNVVTVAQDGGDFTSVQAALNSITDNSATNKYVVWVAPGTFAETVTMKQWVDIEGASEKATKITFTGSSAGNTGTVVGASNAELRSLTVENTGGGDFSTAIYNNGVGTNMSLLHVTVTASGGSTNYGVYNYSSSPSMNNVTATTSGGAGSYNYGVYNHSSSSPGMNNVTATASDGSLNVGVYNHSSSSPSMSNVTATASSDATNYGVYNYSSSPSMNNVTATASGGYLNYGVLNTSCPALSMNNVTATASGGTASYHYGVYNSSSSPSMNNVTATASGDFHSYGVYNESSSSPSMSNVTATASGGDGSLNYGVFNKSSSSPSMNKVASYASGGSPYAIYNNASSPGISNSTLTSVGLDALFNEGGSIVLVRNSQLTGNIWTDSSADTVKVGGSYMNGGIGGYGTVTCAGNYDENFLFFASTCP